MKVESASFRCKQAIKPKHNNISILDTKLFKPKSSVAIPLNSPYTINGNILCKAIDELFASLKGLILAQISESSKLNQLSKIKLEFVLTIKSKIALWGNHIHSVPQEPSYKISNKTTENSTFTEQNKPSTNIEIKPKSESDFTQDSFKSKNYSIDAPSIIKIATHKAEKEIRNYVKSNENSSNQKVVSIRTKKGSTKSPNNEACLTGLVKVSNNINRVKDSFKKLQLYLKSKWTKIPNSSRINSRLDVNKNCTLINKPSAKSFEGDFNKISKPMLSESCKRKEEESGGNDIDAFSKKEEVHYNELIEKIKNSLGQKYTHYLDFSYNDFCMITKTLTISHSD